MLIREIWTLTSLIPCPGYGPLTSRPVMNGRSASEAELLKEKLATEQRAQVSFSIPTWDCRYRVLAVSV